MHGSEVDFGIAGHPAVHQEKPDHTTTDQTARGHRVFRDWAPSVSLCGERETVDSRDPLRRRLIAASLLPRSSPRRKSPSLAQQDRTRASRTTWLRRGPREDRSAPQRAHRARTEPGRSRNRQPNTPPTVRSRRLKELMEKCRMSGSGGARRCRRPSAARPGRGAAAATMLWAYVVVVSVSLAVAAELGAAPRLTHTYKDMESRGRLRAFSRPGVSNYSTLLLSERRDALYVGARDAIFSLDPGNISEETHGQVDWDALPKRHECVLKGRSETTECFNFIRVLVELNETHLFVCGTYAYHPMCAYIERENFTLVTTPQGDILTEEGRGRSPHNPTQAYTATLADGELYSAMMKNFLGTEPVIQRSLGRPAMRSDLLVSWLYEPKFVGSEFVREDPAGDEDDKVYFFFTETAREFEFYSKVVVSRVARVCKGDVGGTRMLQRMWTSFQKAQLECSLPERNIHFNLIQDVFTLRTGPGHTDFYAVFTVEVGGTNVSAVCAYSMADVRQAFEGRFKEQKGPDQRWSTSTVDVPEPRPGSCLKSQSSLDLPDRTVLFARDHPLMDQTVEPTGQRPLLVTANARYTQLAVQTVRALSGVEHRVMYMATDAGSLHKAINVNGDMHLIEEMQLFSEPQSIDSLLLLEEKGLLFVGSSSSVLQVPAADCGAYATCGDCVLARDPHCAWDPLAQRCQHTRDAASTTEWIQDIERANASSLCPADPVEEKEMRIQSGFPLLLPCTPPSNLATEHWERDGGQLPAQDPAYVAYPRVGLLLSSPGPHSAGVYACYSLEGGFRRAAASFRVRMPPTPPPTTTATTTTAAATTAAAPTTTAPVTVAIRTPVNEVHHRAVDAEFNSSDGSPAATAPGSVAVPGDKNPGNGKKSVPPERSREETPGVVSQSQTQIQAQSGAESVGMVVSLAVSLALNVLLLLFVVHRARDCKKRVARLVHCEMPERPGTPHGAKAAQARPEAVTPLKSPTHCISMDPDTKSPLIGLPALNESQA